MENARTKTVKSSFERLFERHGLPEAIRSDNGSPFASRQAVHGLSRLSAWWVALGIDLERGRPSHPQDNGAHERLHRDISMELARMLGPGGVSRRAGSLASAVQFSASAPGTGHALPSGTLRRLQSPIHRKPSGVDLSSHGQAQRPNQLGRPRLLYHHQPGRMVGGT
jgi:transposase InsO family protein